MTPTDSDPPDPDNRPSNATPAPKVDIGLALEAAFGFTLSALLCWNAWPWILQHSSTPEDQTGGVIAAVLLYGLAWPAIAAAAMGAQRYAFSGLSRRARLAVAATLLGLVLFVLLRRLAAGQS